MPISRAPPVRTWVLAQGQLQSGRVVAVGLYGDRLQVGNGCEGGWMDPLLAPTCPAMHDKLHPLPLRQLRRLGADATGAGLDPQAWPDLLQRISRAYAEADADRYHLERSQTLSSQEMAELNQQLEASLVALSSDWIWETDARNRFSDVSEEMVRVGLNPAAFIGKLPQLDQLPPVEGHPPAALMAARRPVRDVVYGARKDDGQALYIRFSGDPVFDDGQFKGYCGVASDVTAATLAGMQVLHLARYDSLTGLANRSMFNEELNRALLRASQRGEGLALMFIDLDRFKFVNDTLGHADGDELLIELSEPLQLGGRTMQVSGSVGISLYPADGTDGDTLLRNADAAMYLAKSRGKNNFQFFTPDLAQSAASFFSMENDLRQAIDGDQLVLHYQPVFSASGSTLCGMETLAIHGLEGSALTVEITEGQLMADPDRAQQTLQGLQALGVQVAIDDCGTGYASLA